MMTTVTIDVPNKSDQKAYYAPLDAKISTFEGKLAIVHAGNLISTNELEMVSITTTPWMYRLKPNASISPEIAALLQASTTAPVVDHCSKDRFNKIVLNSFHLFPSYFQSYHILSDVLHLLVPKDNRQNIYVLQKFQK